MSLKSRISKLESHTGPPGECCCSRKNTLVILEKDYDLSQPLVCEKCALPVGEYAVQCAHGFATFRDGQVVDFGWCLHPSVGMLSRLETLLFLRGNDSQTEAIN
jgi:hypothetical protein